MFETTKQCIYIYTYIYNIYVGLPVDLPIKKNHCYVNVYQKVDHSLSSRSPFNGCGYTPPARLASSQCHLQASAYAVDMNKSPMDVFLWYSLAATKWDIVGYS